MTTRYYWWIVTRDSSGKPYLVFGDEDENTARQKGLELLSGLDFELKRLPTRDLSRASSLLKGRRLEETHSLQKATRRLGHNRSLRRLRRKRQGTANGFGEQL